MCQNYFLCICSFFKKINLIFPLSSHSTFLVQSFILDTIGAWICFWDKPRKQENSWDPELEEGPLTSSLYCCPNCLYCFLVAQTKVQMLLASLSCLCSGHLCLHSVPQWSSLPNILPDHPMWDLAYMQVFKESRLKVTGGEKYSQQLLVRYSVTPLICVKELSGLLRLFLHHQCKCQHSDCLQSNLK